MVPKSTKAPNSVPKSPPSVICIFRKRKDYKNDQHIPLDLDSINQWEPCAGGRFAEDRCASTGATLFATYANIIIFKKFITKHIITTVTQNHHYIFLLPYKYLIITIKGYLSRWFSMTSSACHQRGKNNEKNPNWRFLHLSVFRLLLCGSDALTFLVSHDASLFKTSSEKMLLPWRQWPIHTSFLLPCSAPGAAFLLRWTGFQGSPYLRESLSPEFSNRNWTRQSKQCNYLNLNLSLF